MRMKGKKVIASYKDTWDIDSALRPFIAAALRKFLEVKANPKHSDYIGPPGLLFDYSDPESITKETLEEKDKIWTEMIKKMLWAFETEEPFIMDYDFNIEFNMDKDNELSVAKTTITNKEEHQRYEDDLKLYHEKRQEGYDLFGKYLYYIGW